MDAKRIVVIPMRQIPCIAVDARLEWTNRKRYVFFTLTALQLIEILAFRWPRNFNYIPIIFMMPFGLADFESWQHIYTRPSPNRTHLTSRQGDCRMDRRGKSAAVVSAWPTFNHSNEKWMVLRIHRLPGILIAFYEQTVINSIRAHIVKTVKLTLALSLSTYLFLSIYCR